MHYGPIPLTYWTGWNDEATEHHRILISDDRCTFIECKPYYVVAMLDVNSRVDCVVFSPTTVDTAMESLESMADTARIGINL